MKITLRKLFILSIILNFFLIIFLFPKNRARARILFFKIVGAPTRENAPDLRDDVMLTEYFPESMLKSPDTRENKLPSFPLVETHGHLGMFFKTNPKQVSSDLTKYGIKHFVNLSFTHGEDFLKLKKEYSDPRIIHFSTFNWKRMNEDDSSKKILEDLRMDITSGTRGIKLWKNFGLYLKKKNGERLKMDDPELDEVFAECAKAGLIISIHTADPPAFFSPIDAKNERYEELVRHPEWSFYGDEFPKLDDLLIERNRMFKKHPTLIFVSLHFGEYANRLEEADKLLSENPNVYIDIAARIDELGRQPLRAREFFIKWQDRIMFGVDGPPEKSKLEIYSRFLETKDEYFDYSPLDKPRKGFWKISGLNLPKEVLEKIYYKNAYRIYKLTDDKQKIVP